MHCVEQKRQDCAHGLRWPSEHYWFDNHMVRAILGPEVFALPIGQITDEHAQAAIKLLDKFDLVITLESLANNASSAAQKSLNAVLGWNLKTSRKCLPGKKCNPSWKTTAVPPGSVNPTQHRNEVFT